MTRLIKKIIEKILESGNSYSFETQGLQASEYSWPTSIPSSMGLLLSTFLAVLVPSENKQNTT